VIVVVNPSSMSTPAAAYSQGLAVGNFVFVAGQVAFDADMNVVGGDDVAAQTRQAIANVEAVLNATGAGLEDVVSTTVYLTSFDGYKEYDRAYAECFGDHKPARATVRADLVLPELLVEIQAIAYRERP
jgi:2-iminobutanoate/2-iminopropanoate deaminase